MSAVFVTGATGIVGSAVVVHLLRRDVEIVAAVRSHGDAEKLPKGTDARSFEFGAAPAELDAVLAGVDRVFLMRPPQIEDVQTYLFPFIDACNRNGIRQVVFLSLQGVQFNTKTPHHAVEQYLKQTKTPFTSLRPNFFMQNLVHPFGDAIREHDAIQVPAGRSFTALIDARDIGRVAARVFTEPGHIRKAYTLSGEKALTYKNVAKVMSEVLGRPIRYTRPSEDEYLAQLAAERAPEDYIAVQKMIFRIVRMNVSALPNRKVRNLTGQPATTLAKFVDDYRAEWERERNSA
jgi:uncharacterized protein YbjT (DUF2867 family)